MPSPARLRCPSATACCGCRCRRTPPASSPTSRERSRSMRLAVLRGPHTLELTDAPVPEIEADEVLVRVASCGVCASELDMWEGNDDHEGGLRYPGHEVSGVVDAVGGEVQTLQEGDPVAVWGTGRGFADYVAVKAEHCLPAGQLPLEQALAEPVACAVNAVEL